eukprot:scaffold94767_cov37-Tisochrysis_lutea.AAC.2
MSERCCVTSWPPRRPLARCGIGQAESGQKLPRECPVLSADVQKHAARGKAPPLRIDVPCVWWRTSCATFPFSQCPP